MIIFGIDPGYAIVGFGVVEYTGNKFRTINFGSIITDPKNTFPERLKIVYDELTILLDKYKPDCVAIEELFFNKNVKTAINVGQARGVQLLAAINTGAQVYEYTPLQIKQGVVGYGRAEKKQVQEMVRVILGLKQVPKPDDTADALAVAICHAHSGTFTDAFKVK